MTPPRAIHPNDRIRADLAQRLTLDQPEHRPWFYLPYVSDLKVFEVPCACNPKPWLALNFSATVEKQRLATVIITAIPFRFRARGIQSTDIHCGQCDRCSRIWWSLDPVKPLRIPFTGLVDAYGQPLRHGQPVVFVLHGSGTMYTGLAMKAGPYPEPCVVSSDITKAYRANDIAHLAADGPVVTPTTSRRGK